MTQLPAMRRIVVFDDRVLDGDLRQTLAGLGFQVIQVDTVEAGAQLLRETREPLTVLFWVSLAAKTFTGLDQATLLGELLRDASLAQRHVYWLVTPTPVEVRCVLAQLIDRLPVTLLAAPLDRERLLAAVWLAAQRLDMPAPRWDIASASLS